MKAGDRVVNAKGFRGTVVEGPYPLLSSDPVPYVSVRFDVNDHVVGVPVSHVEIIEDPMFHLGVTLTKVSGLEREIAGHTEELEKMKDELAILQARAHRLQRALES